MNRHGSLVWWLVCIGLVLCWVWNFQTAVESSTENLASLEQNELVELKSPATQNAMRMPRMDENIRRADEIVGRMSEAKPIASATITPRSPETLQTSTFGPKRNDRGDDAPFIELTEELPPRLDSLPHDPGFESDSTQLATQPTSSTVQNDNRWQRNANTGQGQHRVSNPYFDAQPTPNSTPTPTDPVLTFDDSTPLNSDFSESTILPELDNVSQPMETAKTEFKNFEDLKQEQAQWQQESAFEVSPADQFVSGRSDMITPIMPAGQQLTSNATTIQQCVNHIEYGKSLARRGAAFAAREEFYSALRLIAQSNDAQTRSTSYTIALREAITALNESDDFFSEISHEGMDVDVAQVVDAHESKIIPMERGKGMSSMIAIQAYFEFARRRMSDAFDENVVASEALYSLGKLFTVAAAHDLTGNPLDYSKAIVMHYSAVDCDPNNFKSSNELGVLMARNGKLEKARDLFRKSLLVEKMPQTWKNLAVVHSRIAQSSRDPQVITNNQELAEQAGREFELARQTSAGMTPKVEWVTPEQFEQTAPREFNEPRTAQAQPTPTQAEPAKPGIFSRWKDLF